MQISDFDYQLPEELIAQAPLAERDASRMLVLNRLARNWSDSHFREFPSFLQKEDVVVINNTRVIPARLVGRRQGSGGRVEIFLVRELDSGHWEALIRPGGRLHSGAQVVFEDDRITAEIVDEPGQELRVVRFHCVVPFQDVLRSIGSTPLPPYIKRPTGVSTNDRERYQTVYSKNRGAIAAPTAGLHFTPSILDEVQRRARVVEITLHVGYGTFEPVRVEEVEQHNVSAERFQIGEATAETINQSKAKGGRVIVIGTTTLRALEGSTNTGGNVVAGNGQTSLTIKPGYKFKIADALLTNFHLPQSSLLLLVSAFADREFILEAYRHAVRERYRFYSYGDCMLIL